MYALAYIAASFRWFICASVPARVFFGDSQTCPSPLRSTISVYVAFGVIIGGRLGHVLIYDPGFYFAHR